MPETQKASDLISDEPLAESATRWAIFGRIRLQATGETLEVDLLVMQVLSVETKIKDVHVRPMIKFAAGWTTMEPPLWSNQLVAFRHCSR